ncbi:MAG: DNA polymerase III subunit alpha [Gammaproteobacteria bacterium]|nr:DNA polymerase III subunit alpha [Gammaproteobacteria bacterium]
MSSPSFVHLRTHTEYSIVDGLLRIESFIPAVAKRGMAAVAITDYGNLFAAIPFYKSAIAHGIKPILGTDLRVYHPQNPHKPYRLTLLCENETGYKTLCRWLSRSYQERGEDGQAIIHPEWLLDTIGLIALGGCMDGPLANAFYSTHPLQMIEPILSKWTALFPGRFYLEIQRVRKPDEEVFIAQTLELAHTYQLPVVATNDVRFLNAEDFEAHEARVCIHEGTFLEDPRRPRPYTAEQYLRKADEMVELFRDIPEALENTVEIAKRCNCELSLGSFYLPDYQPPDHQPVHDYLTQKAHSGLLQRLKSPGGEAISNKRAHYEHRLKQELDMIIQMGFSGYFLIVADFIEWAKNQNIPVGPGRGSGAGSLVAFLLRITEIDPIEFDLLFERFLNPERISMPDFDIDFCMDTRDRVIDYVSNKYGREHVAQIITYGHMAAKAVVRDIGRVLGYPYGFVDKIAKWIPFELGITLEQALSEVPPLKESYQKDEKVKALIDLARKCEGLVRNAGRHAGGLVISPTPLMDFMPLYYETNTENPITSFDKDDVEEIGLVKFDFLGLRTLTIIDWTLKTINRLRAEQGEPPLETATFPKNDPKTLELIASGKTAALFQLESRGMKDLIVRLKPDCFDDIVALVALFRPGPLQSGMVDDYINRKHGKSPIRYPHPELESILKPTYGIIVYQEQVMQIAQSLGGYSLGKADLLRRAMGKKKAEEMAAHRDSFTQGARQKDVPDPIAQSIFDLMEKFAGYGFNKSHSVAYAVISYQTAWLKTHYPAAFMASVLSGDMGHTEKLVGLIQECKNMGLTILPPHVNSSQYKFTLEDDKTIMYGLGAIKGVGQSASEAIVIEREGNGVFTDLSDLCQRIDPHKVNKRVFESLIKSGACDFLGSDDRASLMAYLPKILSNTAKMTSVRQKQKGQRALFWEDMKQEGDLLSQTQVFEKPWSKFQRLKAERETLGLYFTGHPMETYETELKAMGITPISQLSPVFRTSKVAGMVGAIKSLKTKKDERMAFVALFDQTTKLEAVIFSDLYPNVRELLVKDTLLIMSGDLTLDAYQSGYKLTAKTVLSLEQARSKWSKCCELQLSSRDDLDQLAPKLKEILKPHTPGKCPVHVTYPQGEERFTLQLGNAWAIQPKDHLFLELSELLGEGHVRFVYS